MASSKIQLFLLLALTCNKQVVSEGETDFRFVSFNQQTENITLQGDAFTVSLGHILLTTNNASHNNRMGRVLYSHPVKLWDTTGKQASFHTTLYFRITVPGDNNIGDGLTFFMIPFGSTFPTPSTGGSLGVFDLNTGLAPAVFAVEFDLFSNAWDPGYPHIGIDINSRVSRAVARLDELRGSNVIATIDFNARTNTIDVVARYGSNFMSNVSVSHVFDLKTILPQDVQIGVSAATGGAVAVHRFDLWFFSTTFVSDGSQAPIE